MLDIRDRTHLIILKEAMMRHFTLRRTERFSALSLSVLLMMCLLTSLSFSQNPINPVLMPVEGADCYCVDYSAAPTPDTWQFDTIRVYLDGTNYDVAPQDQGNITQAEIELAVANAKTQSSSEIIFTMSNFNFESYGLSFSYEACGTSSFVVLLRGNFQNQEDFAQCAIPPARLVSDPQDPTGQFSIRAQGGKAPYSYEVDGVTNTTGFFTELMPGSYQTMITDDLGATAASAPVEIFDGALLLPVSLTAFSGDRDCSETNLQWSTASEINHSHFLIEASTDGELFRQIETIEGSGNSSETANYHHSVAGSQDNYFRLRMVAYDGTVEFSEVISPQLKCSASSSVFPNPASEVLNLVVDLSLTNMDKVIIHDLLGRPMLTANVTDDQKSSVSLDIGHLAAGSYVLNAMASDRVIAQKSFVKTTR